ncbi:hypothetical protein [Streptomyces chrestomyceticus]|uniref:hypothetical protein n=1 Tax=Streptomyces chrestomyceticus TaxID=68185 RepID=UPI0033F555C1
MLHALELPARALPVGALVRTERHVFAHADTRPIGPGIVLARYPDADATAAPVWFWGMGRITPGLSVRDLRPAEAVILRSLTLDTLPMQAFCRIAAELSQPLSAARPDVHPLARAVATAAAERHLWEYAAWMCQTCRTRNAVSRETTPGACRVCDQL